jgi:hypothetical protein
MIWTVSSGSPDYAYKFGEGTVTNGRFAITLPSDPPAEAVESFGIGIGIVMVLAPGVVLPDGKITTAFSAADILGLSTRGSVVWRAKSLNLPDVGPPPGWWPLSFPVGYACGACTPAPDAGGFDGFAPTSCDQIQINAYVQADVCNWT